MSSAPGKKSSFDFLKELPDTGYRPPKQEYANQSEAAAEPLPGAVESGAGVLMVLLRQLVGSEEPMPVSDLESRAAKEGVDTLAFYRALTTLLESQLATKDERGMSPTEAGRKVAAFSAS